MKKFELPEVTVEKFQIEDVITTSEGIVDPEIKDMTPVN